MDAHAHPLHQSADIHARRQLALENGNRCFASEGNLLAQFAFLLGTHSHRVPVVTYLQLAILNRYEFRIRIYVTSS